MASLWPKRSTPRNATESTGEPDLRSPYQEANATPRQQGFAGSPGSSSLELAVRARDGWRVSGTSQLVWRSGLTAMSLKLVPFGHHTCVSSCHSVKRRGMIGPEYRSSSSATTGIVIRASACADDAPPRSPSRCSGLESGSHNLAARSAHRLTCQPQWRERLRSEQPGSHARACSLQACWQNRSISLV